MLYSVKFNLHTLVSVVLIFIVFNLFYYNNELNKFLFIKSKYRYGVPYVYEDEVDLRIIVITHNRHESLKKLLNSIESIHLDGDTAALEIWIDPNRKGVVHNLTLEAANNFTWSKGSTRVHVHPANVGILGQWIDTWRPLSAPSFRPFFPETRKVKHARRNKAVNQTFSKHISKACNQTTIETTQFPSATTTTPTTTSTSTTKTTTTRLTDSIGMKIEIDSILDGFKNLDEDIITNREIALILEDDMTVSQHAYRWLKAAHKKYSKRRDFAGVTLYSNSVKAHNNRKLLVAPRNHSAFMYVGIGTWGFSPSPHYWYLFQDWYHWKRNSQNSSRFWPLVPGALPSYWFEIFLESGSENGMWSMWFIYFSEMMNLFTVYSNIEHVRADPQSALGVNREEVGLHFPRKGSDKYELLLQHWDQHWEDILPDEPVKFGWSGEVLDDVEIE